MLPAVLTLGPIADPGVALAAARRASDADSKQGEVVAEQAKQAFKEKRFEEAARLFMRAYALTKQPALVFNAARSYEEAGKRGDATSLFRLYTTLSDDVDGVADARARIRRLEGAGSQLPSGTKGGTGGPAEGRPAKDKAGDTPPSAPTRTTPASSAGKEPQPPPKPEMESKGNRNGPAVTGSEVAATVGGLAVKVEPRDATLEVSGPGIQKATSRGDWRNAHLAPGRYRITASAPGFEEVTQSVVVLVDYVRELSISLAKLGSLEVLGSPVGAKVEIAGPGNFGAVQGLPVTVDGTPLGQYRIKVSRPGYVAAEYTAKVGAGERARVAVKLARDDLAQDASGAAAPVGPLRGYTKILPGSFVMGSPEGETGRRPDEAQHKVKISRAFWLKKTEVTQGEWLATMGKNPAYFKSCGESCPVEQVTWFDAVAYCNTLSRSEGLEECYVGEKFTGLDCSGYRLPTEAEWEYAARAGAAEARHGPLGDVAWFSENSARSTKRVSTMLPNRWGLSDMLGNVWEWTQDWKGEYREPAVDPVGPAEGESRIVRGGSWSHDSSQLRFATRHSYAPGTLIIILGFRPARTVSRAP